MEVDAIQGAFFLSPRLILEKVNWFDEDYFLDGEDLDLCWKIKSLGKRIVYYPKVKVLHIKKASKKKVSGRYANRGVKAMMLFYKKHMQSNYPMLINLAVVVGIYLLMIFRTVKYSIFR